MTKENGKVLKPNHTSLAGRADTTTFREYAAYAVARVVNLKFARKVGAQMQIPVRLGY